MEDMSTRLLTEYDVELRLQARAMRGSREDGLALLKEFEDYDRQHGLENDDTY
jgi:hypothetical protein